MTVMTREEMIRAAREVNKAELDEHMAACRTRTRDLETEIHQLRGSLVNTIVELPDGRDVSLETILAFPDENHARKRCTVCREVYCSGEHDRRRR